MPNSQPSRKNTNTHTDTPTSSNVIFKLLKTKGKYKVFKAIRIKRNSTHRGRKRTVTTDFLSETSKSEDNDRHL